MKNVTVSLKSEPKKGELYTVSTKTIYSMVALGEEKHINKVTSSVSMFLEILTLLVETKELSSVRLLMKHFVGHSQPKAITGFLDLFSGDIRETLKKSLSEAS